MDQAAAEAFYAQPEALDLIEDYLPEMDSELRSSPVKAAMYVLYRQQGLQPFYADMAACRRAPGAAGVDRHFSEHARHRMNTMSQPNLQKIVKMANKAGINTQGKFYVGGLGRYTDPAAWCSTADDVLSVARKRNYTVQGAVKHQGSPIERPAPKQRLAPDIMNRYVNRILKDEPATAEKVRKNKKHLREVKERVLAKHTKQR